MKTLDIQGDAFYPEWNYTIRPRSAAKFVWPLIEDMLNDTVELARHRAANVEQRIQVGVGSPRSNVPASYGGICCPGDAGIVDEGRLLRVPPLHSPPTNGPTVLLAKSDSLASKIGLLDRRAGGVAAWRERSDVTRPASSGCRGQ